MRRTLQDLRPAPGDLRIVQDFVNTADLEMKTEELATPWALSAWLTRNVLLAPGTELEEADLQRILEFRESLRRLLAAGESAGPEVGDAVNRVASSALLRASFGAGGELRLEPASSGVDAALGRLVAILAAAQRDGLWPRFKACASDTCRAAFYDFATNRSTLWCQPRCGGRVRARDFRSRQRRPTWRW